MLAFCYPDFLSYANRRLGIGRAACVVALCAGLAGCAAPSPPLPPSLELPTPVSDLKAVRKGNKVLLTWTQPQQTTDGDGIRFPGPTRICQSVPAISDIKLTECGTPVAEVASSQLETTKQQAATNTPARVSAKYAAVLPSGWTANPAAFATFAIESLNTNHRAAELSNQVRVSTAPTQPPPTDLQAQLTEEGVMLTWAGPLLSIAPGIGIPHYSYRVYRNLKDSPQRTLVGESVMGTETRLRLADQSLVWEKTYEYRVVVATTVGLTDLYPCPGPTPGSLLLGGLADCTQRAEVEGEDSAPVTVVAHDVFPPAIPTGLQAVFSGEGQKPFIDLTWNAGTAADLAGYNVYRREGAAPSEKINTDLVKAPAFRDAGVASGHIYFYSVAAVDLRANESEHSEEATEQAP